MVPFLLLLHYLLFPLPPHHLLTESLSTPLRSFLLLLFPFSTSTYEFILTPSSYYGLFYFFYYLLLVLSFLLHLLLHFRPNFLVERGLHDALGMRKWVGWEEEEDERHEEVQRMALQTGLSHAPWRMPLLWVTRSPSLCPSLRFFFLSPSITTSFFIFPKFVCLLTFSSLSFS